MKQVRVEYEYRKINEHLDDVSEVVFPMADDFADDVIQAAKCGTSQPYALEQALKYAVWMIGGSFNRIMDAEIAAPSPRWRVSWSDREGNEQAREFERAEDAFLEAEYLYREYDGVDVTPID